MILNKRKDGPYENKIQFYINDLYLVKKKNSNFLTDRLHRGAGACWCVLVRVNGEVCECVDGQHILHKFVVNSSCIIYASERKTR